MHKSFLNIAKCPVCNSNNLTLKDGKEINGQIEQGELYCLSCNVIYPIIDGIPVLVNYHQQKNTIDKWNTSDDYSEYILSPTKCISKTVEKISKNTEIAVDAGCGYGVYSPYFKSKEIVCVDLVPFFLKKLYREYKGTAKLHLVIADIRNLPLRKKCADIVFCSEVLEHLKKDEFMNTVYSFSVISRKTLLIDIPNESSFVVESARKLFTNLNFYKNLRNDLSDKRLYHQSHLGIPELQSFNFDVHGCIGWVAAKYIKVGFFWDVFDFFAWRFPKVGGTLIGIKKLDNN